MHKYKELINKIKNLRSLKKTTQSEIAQQIGVSFRTYQRMESGHSSITIEQLENILNALKPESEELINTYLQQTSCKLQDCHQIELRDTNKMMAQPLSGKTQLETEMIKELFSRNGHKPDHGHIIGYWEWNLCKNTLYWSKEMFQIFGLEAGVEVGLDFIRENIEDGHWERLENNLKRIATGKSLFHDSHSLRKPCGEKVFFEITAKRFYKDKDYIILHGIIEKLN